MSERRKLTYGDRKSTSTRPSTLPVSNRMSVSSIPRRSQISRPSSVGPQRIPPSSVSRCSSATRSSSVRRTQGDRDPYQSGGLRRYGSDSYLNTPSRFSTPMGRSPAASRHSVMPTDSTVKSKHENAAKLQEILEQDEQFFTELNLKNGCLKSMTTNQFYLIMMRFVRLISGKELDTFMTAGDPINGIMKFMEQVNYPYTVSKSMLKAPTAGRTFDQIIAMMLWLGEIVCATASSVVESDMDEFLFAEDENFPNTDFTALFSKSVQKGYQLWNSNSEDHEAFIERLTNELISEKSGKKATTVAELKVLEEKLRGNSQQLVDNPVKLKNEQHFQQLEANYNAYEMKLGDLTNQIEDKRDQLAAVNVSWNDKRVKVQKSQEALHALINQVKSQKHNVDNYKQLAVEISMLKASVARVRDEIQTVRDEESNQQTNRARLLQKVTEAIGAMNDRGLKIVKLLNQTRLPVNDEYASKLHLPASPTIQQVNDIEKKLRNIHSVTRVEKHKAQIELERATTRLNIVKAQADSLAKDYANAEKVYKKAVFDNEVTTKKANMKNKKNENSNRELVKRVEDAEAKLKAVRAEIVKANAEKDRMETENAEILASGEAKAMEIIAEKQRLCDELDELDVHLDRSLEGLDYPQ